MKPLAIDLYCGLGGWAEGFLAEGYRVVGFDIERHDYGTGGYPGQLVLQDALTLHGRQFKDAAVIVASPPCQKYSYMAMPWSKAKALIKHYEESAERRKELTALFDACFRIQREASEAAGHHIPMVVENVRGAQRWVGRAKANYGSYYLWGDVGMVGKRVVAGPSLMYGNGIAPQRGRKTPVGSWDLTRKNYNADHAWAVEGGSKVPGFRFDGSGGSFQTASVAITGQKHPEGNCSSVMWKDREIARYCHPTEVESAKLGEHLGMKTLGHVNQRDGHTHARHLTNQAESDAVKEGGDWWNKECRKTGMERLGSKSTARKAASAAIAKIPLPLARHIARSFSPVLHSTP